MLDINARPSGHDPLAYGTSVLGQALKNPLDHTHVVLRA